MAEIITAESSRVSLYHSVETVWGETPATPTMNELQFTSITGGHKKTTVVPTTIRADRMQESLVRVGEHGEMGFGFELKHTQYDALLRALVGASAFSVVSLTLTDISAASGDSSFNTLAGNFVTAGVVVGMWIRVAGFTGAGVTADNGVFRVVSVTTTKIVVAATLVTNPAGDSITISAKMARNGIARSSFCIEERYNDITEYASFTGMRLNSLALTMNNQSIITGTWAFMGRQGIPAGSSVAGSSVAAASNLPMDSSNNVIEIVEGGVTLATPVFNASLNILNNVAMQPAVSSRFPIGVRYGVLEVTGSIEVYFVDLALMNKFVNHTATSLVLKLRDDNLKALYFTIPRLQFETGDLPVTGNSTDVFITLPFRASFDSVLNNVFQIDSIS